MPKIKANNIELFYQTFGSQSAEPLLLIGGLGWQMIHWDQSFCQQLADGGHFVIRFDHRDTGLSTWLNDSGEPNMQDVFAQLSKQQEPDISYTVSDMAADCIGLFDAIGIPKAHICGASLGGMVAQTLAIQYPERVLSLISFMSTTGNPDLVRPASDGMDVATAKRIDDRDSEIKRALGMAKHAGGTRFPVDEQFIIDFTNKAYDRGFCPEGISRHMAAALCAPDRRPSLRELKLPTLVIHGDSDPLVPLIEGIDTHENIPGSKLHVIPGLGHTFPQGAWSEVAEAINDFTAQQRV